MVEERGFESLFLPEHTHIPVSRDTPYPGGGELPPEYSHTLDPFAALAAIGGGHRAAQARHRRLPVIQRDPIVTAKEVATVDHISGGRFLFGVGAGWNIEEMAEPRHRPDDALPAHARERRGDEGDLDRGRGRVPRPDRRLRPDLVLAEAGAEAAPAGARRRAAARRCSTAWWPTATSGSRTGSRAPRSWASGSPSFSGAPRRPAAGPSR